MKNKSTKVKLKPFSPNYRIPDPKTGKHIPADGIEVDITDKFWARRLKDGDCVLVEEDKSKKPSSVQVKESKKSTEKSK
ncbi:MAG: DUF2635 domain-containing protein [Deltaproteobacteria bacterium CG_4_10_14_0_2_um_filter_43_8]|nr:MAG: DUF2635 domain-containing protein [Deltaproteobacteria bacterium CG11_big_fil_rev_8_21_14_0_20_42_23]PJA20535.1 MAG: DUF2635 domain-containing protein [Deltaproteobacteria bacterium CG_4_10_14_0_2_um_filter_43_8]PJC65032.1 MAG: DUF2635 domain-containing protein [Deltaproteobacteria bacterium CG_4_9_14_0_2_um_filter_42_21]